MEQKSHLCKSLQPSIHPTEWDNMGDQGKTWAEGQIDSWNFVCNNVLKDIKEISK
jgi:hypothetical protein